MAIYTLGLYSLSSPQIVLMTSAQNILSLLQGFEKTEISPTPLMTSLA
jgi:hypothetical protein